MPAPEEVTALLKRYQAGDQGAAEELVPLVSEQLHRLAQRALARLPAGQTLQTTALVNEAWIRIAGPGDVRLEGREHFMAVAAKAMRSVTVDRIRRRGADRRGGGWERIELDAAADLFHRSADDLVALDAALDELALARPELARVVELRFFGGLKHPEIARVLEVPLRRVERDWSTARAWLYARLVDATRAGAGDEEEA